MQGRPYVVDLDVVGEGAGRRSCAEQRGCQRCGYGEDQAGPSEWPFPSRGYRRGRRLWHGAVGDGHAGVEPRLRLVVPQVAGCHERGDEFLAGQSVPAEDSGAVE